MKETMEKERPVDMLVDVLSIFLKLKGEKTQKDDRFAIENH